MRTYTIILHAGIRLYVRAFDYMSAKLAAMKQYNIGIQSIKQVI